MTCVQFVIKFLFWPMYTFGVVIIVCFVWNNLDKFGSNAFMWQGCVSAAKNLFFAILKLKFATWINMEHLLQDKVV